MLLLLLLLTMMMMMMMMMMMRMMMMTMPMSMQTNTAPAAVLASPHPIKRVSPPPPTSPLYAPSRYLPQVQSHARAHAHDFLL